MDDITRVFVSPHPDDIAYSCFASLVNPPADLGRTLIVTVFDESLFAHGNIGSRGSREEITQARRGEDAYFVKSIGCRHLSLGLADSSARDYSQDVETENSLVSTPKSDELCRLVSSALANSIGHLLGRVPFFVPLGVGSHEDHCAVRDAVRLLAADCRGNGITQQVLYYEDLPYAARLSEESIAECAQNLLTLAVRPIKIDMRGLWPSKQKAVETYGTQLESGTLPAMWKHALQVGGEFSEAERLWVVDSDADIPLVQAMVWISWESTQSLGGYATMFENLGNNPTLQKAIGRTILLGPLYMPMDSPEYRPLEEIHAMARHLGCAIIYPTGSEGYSHTLSKRACAAFRDIERRHQVDIYYLRDRAPRNHRVDRLLVNLSAVVDNSNVYSETLPLFLEELQEQMDLKIQIGTQARARSWQVMYDAKDWTDFNPADNRWENSWKKEQCRLNPDFYVHKDNDSLYGLLLAQPAAECLEALFGRKETCLLVTSDTLSLPTAYALKLTSNRRNHSRIRTLFYAGELQPIRNLATGDVTPRTPSLADYGGYAWEAPIRALVTLFIREKGHEKHQKHISRKHFLDFIQLRHFASHLNVLILQHAWKLDGVAATSHNVSDELRFLDRFFDTAKPCPVFHPGIRTLVCDLESKEQSRRKLLAYAKLVWGYTELDSERTVIATHIARAVSSKAFPRDLALIDKLREHHLQDSGEELSVLLIIVTSWAASTTKAGDYRIIDAVLEQAAAVNSRSTNFRVRVVNQRVWPDIPEMRLPETELSRDNLHQATDLSLSLSTYDSFAIAPLEPLSCGAVVAVSSGCGCAGAVMELDGWEQSIVVIDFADELIHYLSRDTPKGKPFDAERLFQITSDDKHLVERATFDKAARAILKILPANESDRRARIDFGRKLASHLSWERQIKCSFIPIIEKLFANQDI